MLYAIRIFAFASPLLSAKLKSWQPLYDVIGLGLLQLTSYMPDKFMCYDREKCVFIQTLNKIKKKKTKTKMRTL